ncbi:MAG: L-lactate permease, partial [Anaerolineales bacterium]|nr:L-lactate permease [Anaerolineales bacterium]
MNLPDLNLLNVLLAAAPLLVVLYLMMWRNWGGAKAGPAGFVVALVVSLVFFGANLPLILVSIGKAFLLALFVLYIIWMALLFYHVVDDAGVIAAMSSAVGGLARNRASQALLVAWLFGSFLQGASGFGVPAAVVAPLLLGLGFAPNVAVVIAL